MYEARFKQSDIPSRELAEEPQECQSEELDLVPVQVAGNSSVFNAHLEFKPFGNLDVQRLVREPGIAIKPV